jgi:ABC-type bacteriocin/lantibiotic exporter with double-glycine peptidase domain
MKRNKKEKRATGDHLRYILIEILLPRKWLLLLGLILIIVNRLAGLVLPGSSKYLIDEVIANSDMEMFKWLLIAVASAVTVQAFSSFFLTRLLSVEAQHLISVLRAQIQRHIIHLPISYFNNNRAGELVSRIMSDVEGVRNLVGHGFGTAFRRHLNLDYCIWIVDHN